MDNDTPKKHTHSLTHAHTHALTHARTLTLTHSLTHTLTDSLTNPRTYSLTHSLTHSRTNSPTHSLTETDLVLLAAAVAIPASHVCEVILRTTRIRHHSLEALLNAFVVSPEPHLIVTGHALARLGVDGRATSLPVCIVLFACFRHTKSAGGFWVVLAILAAKVLVALDGFAFGW